MCNDLTCQYQYLIGDNNYIQGLLQLNSIIFSINVCDVKLLKLLCMFSCVNLYVLYFKLYFKIVCEIPSW